MISEVMRRIKDTAERTGQDPGSISLLGATKRVPPERINEAIDAGLTLIGENRVQDAEQKFPSLKPVRKHFIGHLQTNKVKKALALFDCIESVDSLKLAEEISHHTDKEFPIFLEVNIGKEESKSGFLPDELESACERIKALPKLIVEGLMCIPPEGEDPRPYFRKTRELKKKLGLSKLSMGMSADFEIAIEEGADIVRVGTALFGKRI